MEELLLTVDRLVSLCISIAGVVFFVIYLADGQGFNALVCAYISMNGLNCTDLARIKRKLGILFNK